MMDKGMMDLEIIKGTNMSAIQDAVIPMRGHTLNEDGSEGKSIAMISIAFPMMLINFSAIIAHMAGTISGKEDKLTIDEFQKILVGLQVDRHFLWHGALFSQLDQFISWWLCQEAEYDDYEKMWYDTINIAEKFNDWVVNHQNETMTEAYDLAVKNRKNSEEEN